MLGQWFNRLTSCLTYPRLPCPCLLCDSSLPPHSPNLLCSDCAAALPHLQKPLCACCSLPLATGAQAPGITTVYCGQCLAAPPSFSHSLIPFRYDFPLDALIHKFKYQQQLSAGKSLAQLLLHFVQQQLHQTPLLRPDMLVPVPLHWRRQWQRGFNQAELLAQPLSKALGIPLRNSCQRRLHNHSQQGLSRRQRLRNLRQAFAINPAGLADIQGKHLALVDDVVTTGATARCLSAMLRRAGAAQVDIWALARTPAPDGSSGTTTL